jgi:hypothetical protein
MSSPTNTGPDATRTAAIAEGAAPARPDGYLVVEDDGSWPVWFPRADVADAATRIRQVMRGYPRGPEVFRGHRCWVGQRREGSRYAHIQVGRPISGGMTGRVGDQPHRKRMAAHRVSFYVFHGHNPMRGTVEHACKQRLCVNPWHLDDLTFEENQDLGRRAETGRSDP